MIYGHFNFYQKNTVLGVIFMEFLQLIIGDVDDLL